MNVVANFNGELAPLLQLPCRALDGLVASDERRLSATACSHQLPSHSQLSEAR
jgi:hypothetical protein